MIKFNKKSSHQKNDKLYYFWNNEFKICMNDIDFEQQIKKQKTFRFVIFRSSIQIFEMLNCIFSCRIISSTHRKWFHQYFYFENQICVKIFLWSIVLIFIFRQISYFSIFFLFCSIFRFFHSISRFFFHCIHHHFFHVRWTWFLSYSNSKLIVKKNHVDFDDNVWIFRFKHSLQSKNKYKFHEFVWFDWFVCEFVIRFWLIIRNSIVSFVWFWSWYNQFQSCEWCSRYIVKIVFCDVSMSFQNFFETIQLCFILLFWIFDWKSKRRKS